MRFVSIHLIHSIHSRLFIILALLSCSCDARLFGAFRRPNERCDVNPEVCSAEEFCDTSGTPICRTRPADLPSFQLIGVQPASGPDGGGILVSLSGSGFPPAGTMASASDSGRAFTVTVNNLVVSEAAVTPDGKIQFTLPSAPGLDGPVDISVSFGSSHATLSQQFRYLVSDTSAFAKRQSLLLAPPLFLSAGHLNSDTFLDLAIVVATSPQQILLYLGDGQGGFQQAQDLNIPLSVPIRAIAIADINGDGQDDILSLQPNGATAGELQARLGGGFSQILKFVVGANPLEMVVGKFNNDAAADVVIGENGSSISIVLGVSGTASTGQSTAVMSGVISNRIHAGDFNGDGFQDIVAVEQATKFQILRNDGSGTFTQLAATATPATFAVPLDFNGLGMDLAMIGSRALTPLIGDGKGGFSSVLPSINQGLNNPKTAAVLGAHRNMDGRFDLAVANPAESGTSNGSIALFLADDTSGLKLAESVMVPMSPSAIVTGDVNSDGRDDLILIGDNQGGAPLLLLLSRGR